MQNFKTSEATVVPVNKQKGGWNKAFNPTPEQLAEMQAYLDNPVYGGVHKLAKKFGVSHGTICNKLKRLQNKEAMVKKPLHKGKKTAAVTKTIPVQAPKAEDKVVFSSREIVIPIKDVDFDFNSKIIRIRY